jgi:thiamine-monophosphate kinase
MKLSDLGEDRFLERLRERVPKPGPQVKLGIGDDAAALVMPDGEQALVSTDVLVEGVHFTRQTLPPRFIGRKAVAINVSDVAAMGGRPLAVLLSLMTPVDSGVGELLELFDGFIERARELGVDLVGGNLSSSPGPMVVDVTIIGASHGGKLLRRRGARAGEAVYVSGKLGASAEGLRLLNAGLAFSASGALIVPSALRSGPLPLAEQCLRAHIDPEPRVELGKFLCERGIASACIDLSDGLAQDLNRLCAASGVGSRIEEGSLPIHPGVLAWERLRKKPPLELAVAGGEDYELLFTSRHERRLEEWRQEEKVPLTRIGRVTKSSERVRLVTREGRERALEHTGWDHFRVEQNRGI